MFAFDNAVVQTRYLGSKHPDHPLEYWWRVESTYHWVSSTSPPKIEVSFERYFIVRATKQTVVLNPYPNPIDRRFSWIEHLDKRVLKLARKRFAYPTKALAWDSWCIRQRKRLGHAQNALHIAEATNRLIDENPWKDPHHA